MNYKILALTVAIFLIYTNSIFAQSSDAGLFTVSSVSDNLADTAISSNLGFGFSLGYSGKPESLAFNTYKFEGHAYVKDGFILSAFFPVYSILYRDKNVFPNNSIGDMIFGLTYKLPLRSNLKINLLGGVKLNSSSIDKEELKYYFGQGTNDLFFCINSSFHFFDLFGGVQIPISRYSSSNYELSRGTDLLVKSRFSYRINSAFISLYGFGITRLNNSIETLSGINYLVPDDGDIIYGLGAFARYNIKNILSFDVDFSIPINNKINNYDLSKRSVVSTLCVRYFL